MKLVPLSDIDDHELFTRGMRFRIYNVGLNVKDKKDDYYEYMLADNPSEPEYMLLTNVVGYKAGSSLALVKTLEDKTKHAVNGKALKYSMGVEGVFWVRE
jgi:hypothetical protein